MNKPKLHPVVVRGAGDLASGVILRLARAGVPVVALETASPLSVRRSVSFSEAVYEGRTAVEGTEAVLASGPAEALEAAGEGRVALLVDPDCSALAELGPRAFVDAVMAKRNLGTRRGLAPAVVALGPGFEAGVEADAVVETKRGHDLGRVIWKGFAAPDSGVPGFVEGRGPERVLRAPLAGRLEVLRGIGEAAEEGEAIARVVGPEGRAEFRAPFRGMIRGMLRDGSEVWPGLKIGDIDPRLERRFCYTVSDKSLAVSGGVLEALLALLGKSLL